MFSYFICIFFVTSFEGVRCWCVFSIQVNFISLTLTLDLWPLRTLRQLSVQVSVLLGDSRCTWLESLTSVCVFLRASV